MIKKNDETGKEKTKISSFKKFSDLNSGSKEPVSGASMTALPMSDSDLPCNPNLPTDKTKKEVPASTRYLKPNAKDANYDKKDLDTDLDIHEKVEFYGKVARLPKKVKASKGINFLENVKISKSSIWYILVEKQDNELQMVKYNQRVGVDINRFVNELKSYYITKYEKSPKLIKLIENINIEGGEKFSSIKNIPLIEVGGKKMISIITEDLIKLLSK
jgi:hypothetical protein